MKCMRPSRQATTQLLITDCYWKLYPPQSKRIPKPLLNVLVSLESTSTIRRCGHRAAFLHASHDHAHMRSLNHHHNSLGCHNMPRTSSLDRTLKNCIIHCLAPRFIITLYKEPHCTSVSVQCLQNTLAGDILAKLTKDGACCCGDL